MEFISTAFRVSYHISSGVVTLRWKDLQETPEMYYTIHFKNADLYSRGREEYDFLHIQLRDSRGGGSYTLHTVY